jgi:hypothetical protein
MPIADIIVNPDMVRMYIRQDTIYRLHIFLYVTLVIHAEASPADFSHVIGHTVIVAAETIVQILLVMTDSGQDIDSAG